MSIVHVDTQSAHAANTDTVTVTKPTGTQANDFLIAFIAIEDETQDPAAPGGWTELGDLVASIQRFACFWKVAGASEGASYDFTAGTSTTDIAATLSAYRGVDTASPVDTSNSVANATSTNPSLSVTTTVANAALVAALGFDISSGKPPTTENYSSDDGMTERHDDLGGGDLLHACYDELDAGAAGSKTRSFTYSSSETVHSYFLVALTPASRIIGRTLNYDFEQRKLVIQSGV